MTQKGPKICLKYNKPLQCSNLKLNVIDRQTDQLTPKVAYRKINTSSTKQICNIYKLSIKKQAQPQEHTFALFCCPVDREINLKDFPLARREALVILTREIYSRYKLFLHPLIPQSLFRCILASV